MQPVWKTIPQKQNIVAHMKTHSNVKSFKCEICGKLFTRKNSKTKHVNINTCEKVFPCKLCERYFMRKGKMNLHTRLHIVEKPFECNICHKCYSWRDAMNVHRKGSFQECLKNVKLVEVNVFVKGIYRSMELLAEPCMLFDNSTKEVEAILVTQQSFREYRKTLL